MTIQRTTAPEGVKNLFDILPYPYPGLPSESEQKQFDGDFWQQLLGTTAAPLAIVEGAQLKLAPMLGGALFTLEAGESILLLGAVGNAVGGRPWQQLLDTVLDARRNLLATVRQSAGGAMEAPASWREVPTPPFELPWTALVPMIGLRYYTPSQAVIVELMRQFAQQLLSLKHLNPLKSTNDGIPDLAATTR